jgi:hypothetical protein
MSGFTPPWLSGSGYGEPQYRVGEGHSSPAFNPTYPNFELHPGIGSGWHTPETMLSF